MAAMFMNVQEKYPNYNIFIVYDITTTASFYKAHFKVRIYEYWQTVTEYSQDMLKLTEKRN